MATSVWDITGVTAAQTRLIRLALLRLMQPVANADPVGRNLEGLLQRDLSLSRRHASEIALILVRRGWVRPGPVGSGSWEVSAQIERPGFERAR